jgi:mono/diheme cytochrome c family protein
MLNDLQRATARTATLAREPGSISGEMASGLRVCVAAVLVLCAGSGEGAAASDKTRGAYLARIMDCGGCHTPGAAIGQPKEDQALTGGDVGFGVPKLGVFFPPNLTPDKNTGLGSWSEADIIRAFREGVRPDGRSLAPAMPWRSYAALTDQDATDLAVYLKSLRATARKVPGPFGPNEKVSAPHFSVITPAK